MVTLKMGALLKEVTVIEKTYHKRLDNINNKHYFDSIALLLIHSSKTATVYYEFG